MRSAWLARLRSLICSLIHSTYIGIKHPQVQAHASECHRGCGRPLGVSALSDQPAAGAVMMGERLGSDDARCSTLPTRDMSGGRKIRELEHADLLGVVAIIAGHRRPLNFSQMPQARGRGQRALRSTVRSSHEGKRESCCRQALWREHRLARARHVLPQPGTLARPDRPGNRRDPACRHPFLRRSGSVARDRRWRLNDGSRGRRAA